MIKKYCLLIQMEHCPKFSPVSGFMRGLSRTRITRFVAFSGIVSFEALSFWT
ncbi:hypothetical protein HanHA300_Chr02g0043111 [Helianthus annuus]|nr:hypothetical protein HanHA300_Chr02g0043111 [Helianthus annuus]KAJ0617861.1 hypothetical protein HanHA89_Chr02g0046561 [Helianthus annuus]